MGGRPPLAPVPSIWRAAVRGRFLVAFAWHVAGAAAAFAGGDQTSVSGNEGWIAKAFGSGLTVAAELEAISVESHALILAGGAARLGREVAPKVLRF